MKRYSRKTWVTSVLIVIIVVGACVLGWLVYDRIKSEPSTTTTPKTTNSQATYKTVASLSDDLGLKVDDELGADLVYVKDDYGFSFSSQALIGMTGGSSGSCGPKSGPAGRIVRFNKSSLSEPGSLYAESDLQEGVKSGVAKEFAGYYLVYSSPQEDCSPSSDEATDNQQTQDIQLLKKVFDSIEE